MTATSGDAASVAGTSRTLQALSLVTVAAILLLVTLGGIVRVTESGLGCPDWPLCYGRLLPPLETQALIEYSHRLLASVTGLLVVATAVAAWRFHPSRRWLLYPAAIAVVLVVTQAIVGGITVETELAPGLILLHLAMAEALLAALLLVAVVAFRGDPRPLRGAPVQTLFLGTAIATYALLLLGSLVTVSGASTACGTAGPSARASRCCPPPTPPRCTCCTAPPHWSSAFFYWRPLLQPGAEGAPSRARRCGRPDPRPPRGPDSRGRHLRPPPISHSCPGPASDHGDGGVGGRRGPADARPDVAAPSRVRGAACLGSTLDRIRPSLPR